MVKTIGDINYCEICGAEYKTLEDSENCKSKGLRDKEFSLGEIVKVRDMPLDEVGMMWIGAGRSVPKGMYDGQQFLVRDYFVLPKTHQLFCKVRKMLSEEDNNHALELREQFRNTPKELRETAGKADIYRIAMEKGEEDFLDEWSGFEVFPQSILISNSSLTEQEKVEASS